MAVLWTKFQGKMPRKPTDFKGKKQRGFSPKSDCRNESTSVSPKIPNPISLLVKIHDFRIYLSMW